MYKLKVDIVNVARLKHMIDSKNKLKQKKSYRDALQPSLLCKIKATLNSPRELCTLQPKPNCTDAAGLHDLC